MILKIRKVLSPEQVSHVRRAAERIGFVDGRLTNAGSSVKNNLQVSQNDPAAAEPGMILRDALFQHPDLRHFAYPRNMARPTVSVYRPGMAYGWHVDEALFPSQPPMRSDLSCTVFLSDPDTYEGGELVIQLGQEQLSYKLPAGDAIVYPSTTIHQVTPVTRGERMVGITWMQSYVQDVQRRELLHQLDEARAIEHARSPDPRMQVLLESLRTNLFRMWSDN